MVQIDYPLHVQYSESIDIRHNRINKFIFIYQYMHNIKEAYI